MKINLTSSERVRDGHGSKELPGVFTLEDFRFVPRCFLSGLSWLVLAMGWGSGHLQRCCFADSCDVRCARKKTEKRFRKTIRTLRRTVSRDQFRVRLSGTDHEVARKAPRPPEPQQSCAVGQLHPRCGESGGSRGWSTAGFAQLGGIVAHLSRTEEAWVGRGGECS